MGWQAAGALSVMTGLAMLGCGSVTGPDLDEQIVGQWEWIESTGGIAGMTLTPASTGETRALRFDSERVSSFRNDSLVATQRYTLALVAGTDTWTIDYLDAGSAFEMQTAELRADTLVLTDPCCDGFVSRYLRDR